MRRVATVWKTVALGAACVLGCPTIVLAQAAKAGVVTTLQGTATVARATAPQPAPLKFRDDVLLQDHIVTGESSLVRILLGGKAVITIRERSALTIHEAPGTSTVEISSGKIALAVAKDRMKPGESVQIKTPNAIAGIRGTVVIAEVTPPAQPGGSVATRFTLLTGIVDVARLDGAFGQPTGQPVLLHPMQTVTVIGHTPPGAVQGISRAEAQRIASEYKVTLPTPPPAANTEVTGRQIEIAIQHSAALTGTRPDDGGTVGVTRPGSAGEGGTGSASTGGSTTPGGGASASGTASVGGGAVTASGGVSAGGTSGLGAGGSVSVGGGGGIGASGGASVGGGGIAAGGGVSVGGGGGLGASGGVSVGGGGIGAGAGVSVGGGGGIGAGAGVTVGGGGIGGTVGVGGIGAGVTVGGGGVGVTVGGGTGGGTTVGGGGTGGGGLIGGIVPRVLPKL